MHKVRKNPKEKFKPEDELYIDGNYVDDKFEASHAYWNKNICDLGENYIPKNFEKIFENNPWDITHHLEEDIYY